MQDHALTIKYLGVLILKLSNATDSSFSFLDMSSIFFLANQVLTQLYGFLIIKHPNHFSQENFIAVKILNFLNFPEIYFCRLRFHLILEFKRIFIPQIQIQLRI